MTSTSPESRSQTSASLSREQAAQMRDFLVVNPTEITPRLLTLDDADARVDAHQLRLEWWREETRLIARITSPSHESPIGQIDLRPEQLPKLQLFLTSTLRTSL